MATIKVFDLIGKNAISMQTGDKIYTILKDKVQNGEHITLDFEGVTLFASPFFNSAIGRLLKDKEISELQQQLKFEHLDEVGRNLLNLVISNAISYYNKGSI
ncbi:STAS-like domain-containing protein [Acinetobacter baumannii]|uniref:STAS-like domain-containing protein n=1 Tax=Acinetobacter baumannii TaxID=470 RepID=UPI003F7A3CDF